LNKTKNNIFSVLSGYQQEENGTLTIGSKIIKRIIPITQNAFYVCVDRDEINFRKIKDADVLVLDFLPDFDIIREDFKVLYKGYKFYYEANELWLHYQVAVSLAEEVIEQEDEKE
jgi:hypothetical protein